LEAKPKGFRLLCTKVISLKELKYLEQSRQTRYQSKFLEFGRAKYVPRRTSHGANGHFKLNYRINFPLPVRRELITSP